MTALKPKRWKYTNDAGLTVPADVVEDNKDGSKGIFVPEGVGGQVVYLPSVPIGVGGGYLQEV